jgi:hypothetical protein
MSWDVSSSGRATEAEVIAELCDQLSERFGDLVVVVDRPDRANRSTSDCDAIVAWGTRRAAVEHTRVYSRPEFPGQLHILNKYRPTVEGAIRSAFPEDGVLIMLPSEELKRGLDWDSMMRDVTRESLRWLPELRQENGRQMTVAGFTRPPVVFKHQRTREGWCRMLFRIPMDQEDLAVAEFRRAFMEKRPRMQRYKAMGVPTWLVLDAPEVGWPNDFIRAFNAAIEVESVEVFDHIYLGCTLDRPVQFVPLKVDDVVGAPQPLYGEFVDLWASRWKVRNGLSE